MKSARKLAKTSAKSKTSASKPRAKKAKSAARKTAGKRSRLGAPGPILPGTPLLGQVASFAYQFAPAGWLPCDGRLLSIMQNQPLFSLLGTTYGGNGETVFALPHLKPVGSQGPGYFIAIQGAYPVR
jgi:Phage Tail Collar Domain